LSQAILMTSCDLIATAKPWQIQTETVKVIFEEFYEQVSIWCRLKALFKGWYMAAGVNE
jgi:truncated hemoglobin YjbI